MLFIFMDKPEQVLILVVCEDVGGEGDEAGRTVLGHSMIRAQQSFQLAATKARLHPNRYLYNKALMSAFLKNLPVKVLSGRCLSV